ncbi:MAG TPA: TRAM domain-containing protein [Thermoanaerobaculia bacterium]|nr:TRAM domain-containing protein [Thermoanaerobaculia bacterium]
MREGDVVTITPTELVAGGDALARIDGFPVFASNVFPGDVARVRLYEVKKGFAKADLEELVTPSPWRRAMTCPIANECGGCDWTALRLDKQLEAKTRILTESLRRIGKLDVATLPRIDLHPSPLNYRLRSRLHREGEAVGFFAMRSNRVVQLAEECEVVGVHTAETYGTPASPPAEQAASRRPRERDAPRSAGETPAVRSEELWELGAELVTDRELTLTVNELTWRLSTDAFFQVNRHLLGTMLRLVTAHASRVRRKQSAVDLYGGVGFFTLPIAKLFERVTLIEGSPVAARYARINVPRHVKVIEAPVEAKMRTLPEVDFTFLDPPRAGTRREVISTIAEKTREVIAYLSCDPVTFARDASRLIASGWRLSTLDLLDLFPNTHHVETLSSFERAQ